MLLTGAQITIETLIEQGCKVLFGYPGGQVIDLYDALYEREDRIKHVVREDMEIRFIVPVIDEIHTIIGAGGAEGAGSALPSGGCAGGFCRGGGARWLL